MNKFHRAYFAQHMVATEFQPFTPSNSRPPHLLSGLQAPDAPLSVVPDLPCLSSPTCLVCRPRRDPGSKAHNGRLQRASPHTGSWVFARDDKTGTALSCELHRAGSIALAPTSFDAPKKRHFKFKLIFISRSFNSKPCLSVDSGFGCVCLARRVCLSPRRPSCRTGSSCTS